MFKNFNVETMIEYIHFNHKMNGCYFQIGSVLIHYCFSIILALLSFVVDFRNFCLLTFTAGGDSCGISVRADTPQELCSLGGLVHAPRKGPPAVNNSI